MYGSCVDSAWAKATGAEGKVGIIADGNVTLTQALGMDVDMSAVGFGPRSTRYAALVEDGVVKVLNEEEGAGDFKVSGADGLLKHL